MARPASNAIELFWGIDGGIVVTAETSDTAVSFINAAVEFTVGLDFESDPIVTVTDSEMNIEAQPKKLTARFAVPHGPIVAALTDEQRKALVCQVKLTPQGFAPLVSQRPIKLKPAFSQA